MYINRAEFYPAAGKGAELTTALEEWVRQAGGIGVRARVSRRVLSPEGAILAIVVPYDDLASFEKARDSLRATTAGLIEKLNAASRHPFKNELFEVLVPRASTGPLPRYSHRALVMPRPDTANEVRDILTSYAKKRQEEGRPHVRLSRQVIPPSGPVFVVGESYERLSELEAIRSKPTASTVNAVAKFAPLVRAPMSQDLFEFIG